MTTPARQREADRATVALQIVLAKIGVETLADSILLWDNLPQEAKVTQVSTWLDDAVKLVMQQRTLAVQIARAFYRLVRALRTGKTVADPSRPEPQFVTLAKLRAEFNGLIAPRLDDKAQSHIHTVVPDPAPQAGPGGRESASPQEGDGDLVEVEEIDGLAEQEKADEQRAEEQVRENLINLGPAYRERKNGKLDTRQPADEVDKARQKNNDTVAARQAASGAREAMNGGRSHLWSVGGKDDRALGWIRVSLTGTPCGWCAMLISRGPVYKSKQSAQFADGDKYHDNCHCIAVQIFSQDEFKNSPQFALNREYQKLWPQVTKGYSGDEALTVWRRYIRQNPKQAQVQVTRPTTNAQEAA